MVDKEDIVDLGEPIGFGKNGQEIAHLREIVGKLCIEVKGLRDEAEGKRPVHPMEEKATEIIRLVDTAQRALSDIRGCMNSVQGSARKVPRILTEQERPPNSGSRIDKM